MVKGAVDHIYINRVAKAAIFTDSRSVLLAIAQSAFISPPSHYVIYEIKEILYDLHQMRSEIVLAWIPSHMGIPRNEKVDYLEASPLRSRRLPHHRCQRQQR